MPSPDTERFLTAFADDVRSTLREANWPVAEHEDVLRILQEYAADPLVVQEITELTPVLIRSLALTAAPLMALRNLDRYIRASWSRASLLRLLAQNTEHLDFLTSLFAASQFFSDIVIRNPEYLEWVLAEATLGREKTLETYREHLAQFTGRITEREARRRTLCRFKRRELLRLGVRELTSHGGIAEYCRELSRLAQVAVEMALADCLADLEARHGLPVPQSADTPRVSYSVVAMGKFGGEELNFSSDIDLVFVYDEEGHTTGATDTTGHVSGRISSHEFYSKLSRDLCSYLNTQTNEGVLYRVDSRLRPEGDSGAMARSISAYAAYFAEQARSWEKIAYIKARSVAGDEDLGDAFTEVARGFVYSNNHHDILLPEIARLKRRIDAAAQQPGGPVDIKRGPGGIREIEFIAAALQLLHGTTLPELRVRATLEALGLLVSAGKFPADTADRLERAYWFFRRVEHALQMMEEQQTHALPQDDEETRALAVRCGFRNVERFRAVLEKERNFVRTEFERLFHEEPTEGADLLDMLEAGGQPQEAALEKLRPHGLDTPEGFIALRELAVGSREIAISSAGQRSFEKMLPSLLEELESVPFRIEAIHNLSHFLRKHHATAATYALLQEHPPVLRLLLRLLGGGPVTSRALVGHPGRFDQMLEGTALSENRDPRTIFQEQFASRTARAAEEEEAIALIRSFKDREALFCCARELLQVNDARESARQTTVIADVCLEEIARLKAERHGLGHNWVIMAFGSFGGRQVHVCADLDLAFFCEPNNDMEKLHRFAREVLSTVSAVTPEGRLWKMDARLRPDGVSAPLAVPLERAERYYRDEAGVWEFQSAARARFVCGSSAIGDRALGLIRDSWKARRGETDIAGEIVNMRQRLDEAHKLPRTALTDLKKSPGGIVDIEFLVQFLQLSHGHEHPDILRPETGEALAAIGEAGLLDNEHVDMLRPFLFRLRTIQRLLRLLLESSRDAVPAHGIKREALERALMGHMVDPRETLDALPLRMQKVRDLFTRVVRSS